MHIISWILYGLSVIKIKITKDYGMCCNEKMAIKNAHQYYFNKYKKGI